MRIKRVHLHGLILAAAAIGGAGLGWVQDGVFQALADRVDASFYIIGMLGWLVFTVWQVLGLRFAALRWRGLLSQGMGLAVVLIFWVCAVIGEVAFFLINGMSSLTLFEVIAGAMLVSGAHTFVLIVLPMVIMRAGLMGAWGREAKSGSAEHVREGD